MTRSPEQRAAQLREELHYHLYRYHVLNAPTITDAEYDRLYEELKQLEAEHPELTTPDSPTQRAGAEPRSDLPKVQHPTPVLSLQNAFNAEDVRAWRERIGRLLPEGIQFDYVVEPKLDGLTVVLTYEDGLLIQGATRGNGDIGEDVTPNLRTIPTVPLRIPVDPDGLPAPSYLVVRGEAFMRLTEFEKLNQRRVDEGEALYMNPRNTAAGSVRQLDPAITADRPLEIACYQILTAEGENLPPTQWDALHYLQDLGFPVMLDLSRHFDDLKPMIEFLESWEERRHQLDFEIDGLVIKVNDLSIMDELGVVGKDPRGMTAFKFPAEERTTQLLDVGINTGRTGVLTPYAILEPVEIGGVIVKQATLHNFDDIQAKDIRIGDTVVVKRSGDVIPYVVGPVTDARTGNEQVIYSPEKCPFCGSDVVREEGEVAYYCSNPACPERLVRAIGYWVSRGAMDIDGLGERIVRQLVDEDLIEDVADLYFLEYDDLVHLEGFAEKKAQNLLDSIDDSRSRPLSRVLTALGIKGVGSTVAELLLDHYPTLDALIDAPQEDLEAIHGMGEHTARQVVEFFNDERNRGLIDKLRRGDVNLEAEEKPQTSSSLEGLTFVLTGTLPTLTRDEATELIEVHGGRVTGSVSGSTSYLLAGNKPGSKYAKAEQRGIPIIGEKELKDLIGD